MGTIQGRKGRGAGCPRSHLIMTYRGVARVGFSTHIGITYAHLAQAEADMRCTDLLPAPLGVHLPRGFIIFAGSLFLQHSGPSRWLRNSLVYTCPCRVWDLGGGRWIPC